MDPQLIVDRLTDALGDALRPEPKPPKNFGAPVRLVLPETGFTPPPRCPGCAAPADQVVEVVQEEGLGPLLVLAIVRALARQRGGGGPHVRVPVRFCADCKALVDRRYYRLFAQIGLGLVAFGLVQIPILWFRGALLSSVQESGRGYVLYSMSAFLLAGLFGGSALLMIPVLRRFLRKDWFFGVRIDRWNRLRGTIEVEIDDPGYAALLRPPAR